MAYFHQGRPREPFLRVPPAVIWLILILVGAHAMRVFAFGPQSDAIIFEYGFVPARYSETFLATHGFNPGSLFERALPFLTYMFLHGSFTHVLVNSVWLLAFGPIVARRFGAVLFLLFFLVCGVAGAVVQLSSSWGSTAPVIGASAAVAGLMAAAFRMLPFAGQGHGLTPIFAPRILVWTAIWTALNVAAGVTGLGTGGGAQLVAWQAHLGGYGMGLLLAGFFDALANRASPQVTPPPA